MFSKEAREWVENLPGRERCWQIMVYRCEQVEGGVKHVLVETFNNAKSYNCFGQIRMEAGKLHFIDETGKEVVVSSMPFIAKETTPEPVESIKAR